MRLVNWFALEDLLVQACEAEIRAFAALHPNEAFFACCLEFDALSGSVELSYGMRRDVDVAVASFAARGLPVVYRNFELRPDHWRYRRVPRLVRGDAWQRAERLLDDHRANLMEDDVSEAAEFFWLRFEYLVECVSRRLVERAAFRGLRREAEFLAYCANEHETLEEVEDRIAKLYPGYRRATAEFTERPRPGLLLPLGCATGSCRHRRSSGLARCTYCQNWYCSRCRVGHVHPELFVRRPFF